MTIYVVLEATVTSDDADLQHVHDRVKALAPMIEAASPGRTEIGRS